ncbi:imm11 family protein [Sulfitobacter geojensis]|uniref:Immunity MXAN-0049 protein domain-containing protein n=1 Tax=Sulfitobacter geojensis TaxID=1342299 RepID=A0AAE3B8J0_9RHOB|nr:DUF1629 domain-containing protein [Sulfitobacter geojensis]MBM1690687.1 hypothetical protein [Sulfitobacter geojensis]MBM1694753.1 hypothetical protein [Sulfitobacter geojensis]MBM1707541.1 hypothetical protein [Sulfitobacter geojensis]MBM1711151.1 hypothetical protein [Sulfitobacter geojensis]MBM1715666.1 hypothetical protein [Sulfitobacter geojensis]
MKIWNLGSHIPDGESESCYRDIVPLDGDWKKIALVDTSVDIGKWGILPTEEWQCGRHLETTNMPTRLKVTKGPACRKDRPLIYEDYINWGGGQKQLCSTRFRTVLEALDPGAHQFVPVSIEDKAGNVVSDDYFWFAPGNRVFALDAQKTQPPMEPYKTGPGWINPHQDRPAMNFDQRNRPVENWAPVFHADKIGDRHVFCDGEFPRRIFMTDTMRQAIEDNNLIGAGVGRLFTGPFRAEE